MINSNKIDIYKLFFNNNNPCVSYSTVSLCRNHSVSLDGDFCRQKKEVMLKCSTLDLVPFINSYFGSDYPFHMSTVNTQCVLEAVVINRTLYPYLFENRFRIKFIAQDPDNPIGTHTHYAPQCYAIMKQPNADLVRESNLKISFNDVKLVTNPVKSLATCRGYLSLTIPSNEQNNFLFLKRISADIGNALNTTEKKINDPETPSEKIKILKQEFNQLTDHHTEIKKLLSDKKLPLDIKVKKTLQIQNNIDSDSQITSISCSRLMEMPSDNSFDYFYNTLEQKIKIKLISKNIPINVLCPKDQKIDILAWQNAFEMIKDHLPENIQKMISHTYYPWKLITN